MNIQALLRENIKNLLPYKSARSEFTGHADVFIDANENPYNLGYNRYPDPLQKELKEHIASWRGVSSNNIFVGNGSDEGIDLLMRAFCEPGKDAILILDPSYGMYTVSANINDVAIIKHQLDEEYDLDFSEIKAKVSDNVKIVFICNPNNPTGNCYSSEAILAFAKSVNAIVVVDEAYIDFADEASCIKYTDQCPNLLVMQTLSKAMGSAGLRLGMCFANTEVIAILNKIKPPYNISQPVQELAIKVFSNIAEYSQQVAKLKTERSRMAMELTVYKQISKIFPSQANFILIEVDDADKLYAFLQSEGIIVRNRKGQIHCKEGIRITIGTPDENDLLLYKLNEYYHAEGIVFG